MKKGFTLIELLVVVLIIGILAAVAFPQYERAVWKTRASLLQTMVRNMADAQERYFLANGEFAKNIEDLDISFDSMPERPTREINRLYEGSTDPLRANADVMLAIGYFGPAVATRGLFRKGPHAGSGFVYWHGNPYVNNPAAMKKILCYEMNTKNNFCVQMYKSEKIFQWYGNSTYTLP